MPGCMVGKEFPQYAVSGVNMKKFLLLLVSIVAVAGVAYIVVSDKKLQQKPGYSLTTSNPNCDPGRSVCVATDQNYSIALNFPEQVHYLKPFKMKVMLNGFGNEKIEAVNVDYTMVGMDMGLNRFTLLPVSGVKGQRSYAGEGILPVCVSGRVDWLANVQVTTEKKVVEASFELEVTK